LPIKEVLPLFLTGIILLIKKYMDLKVDFTEMYPWIRWETFTDSVGSTKHTLGVTGLCNGKQNKNKSDPE
jgi:hypothetical protein